MTRPLPASCPPLPAGAEPDAAARRPAPHRPRRGRRSLRATVAVVVVVGVVSGCAAEQPLPAPRPQAVQEPAPAVPAERAAAIHAEVADAVAAADAARDAALLAPRVTGAAQEVRAARYRLQELLEEAPAPAPLGGPAVRDVLPAVGVPGAEVGESPERAPAPAAASATFPRTWLTVTQAEQQGRAPQLSVLVQEDARSPYALVSTVGLLPGAVVPPVAAPEQGAPPVDPTSADGLALAPVDAVAQYARALDDPEAPEAALFDDDAFRQELLAERAEADAVEFFALETARTARPDAVRAVATADGGALVVGVLESTAVQAVEEEGAVLQLPPQAAALAGRADAPERLEQRWLEVVALAVPPAAAPGQEQEPLRLVGADRVLVEATAS